MLDMLATVIMLVLAHSSVVPGVDETRDPSTADQPIMRLVTLPHPGLFSEDGSGYYDALLREVEKISGMKIDLTLLPNRRVAKRFSEKAFDCAFPADIVDEAPGLVLTRVFNRANAYVVSLDPLAKEMTILDMDGETLAIREGLNYANIRQDDSFNFVEVTDEFDISRLLQKGRVKYAISFFPDLILAEPEFAAKVHFNPHAPVVQLAESFVCWVEKDGQSHIRTFNAAIEEFSAIGKLPEILGEAAFDPYALQN